MQPLNQNKRTFQSEGRCKWKPIPNQEVGIADSLHGTRKENRGEPCLGEVVGERVVIVDYHNRPLQLPIEVGLTSAGAFPAAAFFPMLLMQA